MFCFRLVFLKFMKFETLPKRSKPPLNCFKKLSLRKNSYLVCSVSFPNCFHPTKILDILILLAQCDLLDFAATEIADFHCFMQGYQEEKCFFCFSVEQPRGFESESSFV